MVRAVSGALVALIALAGLFGGLWASTKAYADKIVETEIRLVQEKLDNIDDRLCRIEGEFGLEPKGGDE